MHEGLSNKRYWRDEIEWFLVWHPWIHAILFFSPFWLPIVVCVCYWYWG